MKRFACLTLGGVVALAVAASSWGSSSPRWTLTNLVKVARQRYPAFVGIQPIRLADDGIVYWTAYQQHSDPRTVDVFSWRNGRVRDLGSPGPDLWVADVNSRGQFAVVTAPTPCSLRGCSGPQPPTHSYLWQQGKLTDLGALGGQESGADDINERGQIVGSSQTHDGDRVPSHAFLWENGTMTDLGTLGGRFSEATAINERGQVVGQSQTAKGKLHGFIWQHGKMSDLGALGGGDTQPVALNERGQVVGQSSGSAFIWQNGTMTGLGKLDLSGYPLVCRGKPATSCPPRCPGTRCGLWGSVAHGLDDRGEVVGMTRTNVSAGRAFFWRQGKMTDLGTLGGRSSEALAINDRGMIVGWSDTKLVPWTAEQAPGSRPFVWQAGRMTELPVDYATPTRATAITPSGNEILGWGTWPGHQLLLWTRR